MRSLLLFCLLTHCSVATLAQRAQRIMIGAQTDLIKSDNDGFFEKAQGGIEGSYYFSRKFAVTGGAEGWTGEGIIAIVGARFCPVDEAFIRIRGLIREDICLGAGFSKPLRENLRVEGMADLYFAGHIAIRAGIAYGIGPRP